MAEDVIRSQYEAYPYPERNPKDEAKRLITGSPSHLDEIRHYLFAGQIDTSKPFKALVAGGGTGDATIMLAQQMADQGLDGTVSYLDLSEASRAVAEARAEARGLDNINFHTGRIEDIGELCPGPYDYIDCCGVLHHLPDPEAGLKALSAELAETGGLGLMVYGEYGRTGVYHMQESLRLLVDDENDGERVRFTKRLIRDLPKTNWLKRNPFVGDHLEGGDAGIYDLLLHRRDRAYTVPQLFEFIGAGGLGLVSFIPNGIYNPLPLIKDPIVARRMEVLPFAEQAALAELLYGAMTKHVLYAAPKKSTEGRVADPGDLSMIAFFNGMDAAETAKGIRSGGTLRAEMNGFSYQAPLPRLAPAIAGRLDGEKTLQQVYDDLVASADKSLTTQQFQTQFQQFYRAFNGINRVLLKR